MERAELAALLAANGFVAPQEEADELLAAGGPVEALVERRLTGEPLAWITGTTVFCGVEVAIHPGVYVPRWQTEPLVERALERLPPDGTAIELCTGSGAVAKVLTERRPHARVFASDIDRRAVDNARANGVDARRGDLFDPLPRVRADVVFAVVPYVPTAELPLLQRDTLAFEAPSSYDGGADGADLLRRVVAGAPERLRPGGALLLELGGDQPSVLAPELARAGFAEVTVLADEDGDVRGLEATYCP
jgi:release factor glutamine methyltransferase